MKVLLLLYIIYVLHRTVVSDDAVESKQDLAKYPKKVHRRQILLNNFKNYRKHYDPVPLKTKKPILDNEKYTVFAKLHSTNLEKLSVPDSPYFAQEENIGYKPSVKKVLASYHRLKRSANTKDIQKKGKVNKSKVKPKKPSPKHKTAGKKSPKGHKKGRRILRKSNRRKPQKHLRNRNKRDRYRRKRGKHAQKKQHNSKGHPPKNNNHHSTVVQSRRLIGGKDTAIEDYPYVVSIQKDNQHWCSGALLNPRLVITTANCVWKSRSVSRLKIRAGSRDTYRGGQRAKVSLVMKHPLWSIRSSPDYDLALLLLDRRIRFKHSVHAVDLPNRAMLPSFDDAWVTSWGAERRDGVYDKYDLSLQSYRTRLMSREKCNNITERFGIVVSPNFICLSQYGKRAPCTRDSGAPAVSDGVLYGLASWGIRKLCGIERYPSMFSYLASPMNMDFIINASKQIMSEDRIYPFVDGYPVLRNSNATVLPQWSTIYRG